MAYSQMEAWIREFPRQGLWTPEGPAEIPVGDIRHVVLAGMGGSAVGGDLVQALFEPDLAVPFRVHRDYGLPPLPEGTLTVVVSYSGNTEETLSAFAEARRRGFPVVAASSGGRLREEARQAGIPWFVLPEGYAPRATLGYMLTLLTHLFARLRVLPPEAPHRLQEAFRWLASQEEAMTREDALPRELAEKYYLRLPLLYASRRFFPVVERWRAQLNENAKTLAHTASLPEMNHNEIAGLYHPHRVLAATWATFLHFPEDPPRLKARIQHTAELIYEDVLGWNVIQPEGPTIEARFLWSLWVGDWTSLYLARAYEEDPVAIPRITELKTRLQKEHPA